MPLLFQEETMTTITAPTQAQIHDMLVQVGYYDKQGVVGYAVGVASPQFDAPLLFLDGALHDYQDKPMTFDGDVRFELASISKVFTAALLADYANGNPDLLTTSITSCQPHGLRPLPTAFDGITLLNLANYTSGLPEDDSDVSVDVPKLLPQPYSVASMYGYLHDGNVAVSGPGTTYTYSNLAPSLLAQAIPVAVGSQQSFGELLAQEITGPLGMTRTAPFSDVSFTELPLGMENAKPIHAGWNELPAFTGGLGLVTTPNDMLTWLQFNMGMLDSPLNAILGPMQTPSTTVVGTGNEGQLCIGWFLSSITGTSESGQSISMPILYKAG